MSAPSTELQESVMRAVALCARDQLAARVEGVSPLDVTTASLSGVLGRVGQVVGHSCGELTRKGLLLRERPATYRLTVAGLDWLREDARAARKVTGDRKGAT